MKFRLFIFITVFSTQFTTIFAQPDMSIYMERRAKVIDKISDGIAIFVSAPEVKRNGDVNYEYRQDSNFYYLTGFEEPNSVCILSLNEKEKFVMFVMPRNPALEVWTGKLSGIEGVIKNYNADKAFTINKFDSVLNVYIRKSKKIYYTLGDNKEFNDKVLNTLSKYQDMGKALEDPSIILNEMRLIKSQKEIEILKKAIDITCNAHIEVMKMAKAGMYEYELEAQLEYVFRKNSSQRLGFPSIVGSGPNSCILHYDKNNRKIEKGDLVVIDIGAEYDYYTADVTRTIPINGKFSKEQKEIYQIVLDAQESAIKMLKPGVRFYQIDSTARSIVNDRLRKLGILKETDNERRFFKHGTSHWLGLDVHDVWKYHLSNHNFQNRVLEAGMVLTVEPGIYIEEGAEGVNPKYYNIGVRIEDDILITENGYELLSKLAPRTIEEIEKIMKK